MNIALLSSGTGWHVRDLMRAATLLGHHAEPVDFRRVTASILTHPSPLTSHPSPLTNHHSPTSLSPYDAVIVRTMPPGSLEQVVFRMDVLHRLEAAGKRVLNPARSLEICIDKYLACAKLAAAGLPTPPTMVCQDADSAMSAFEQFGRDVVVKPLFGSEGRGMVRVSDPDIAWRTFRTIERTQAVLYVQQFIHHPGWDLRVFVLGGRVLTAMRRYARDGWRTNVAQGGSTEQVAVTDEEETLAIAAANAVGVTVAGVDLLPRPDGGFYVLEVNAVPGWRALIKTTGIDVAREIVRHLASS